MLRTPIFSGFQGHDREIQKITAGPRCMARLHDWHLMHAVFRGSARILKITGGSARPMVMLKKGLQCVLGGTSRKYCASRRNCKSTAPVSEILVGATGWASSAQHALAPVRYQRMQHGESPGVLNTDAAYNVSVSWEPDIIKLAAMKESRTQVL